MLRVRFIGIGRNKATFDRLTEESPDYDFMHTAVRPHLLPGNIGFAEAERKDGRIFGSVYAGFRPVGSYEISEIGGGGK